MMNTTRKSKSDITLSLIVPVFNEEETVGLFVHAVSSLFSKINNIRIIIIFIDDGSTDTTIQKIVDLQQIFNNIILLELSRNFGKEAALSAGINYADSDIVVPIDVDLQDPPELILEMIDLWSDGYDVVLARRINRDRDHYLKKITALLFYRLYNKITNLKIPENVGDFRLMDRQVVDELVKLNESCRFMKGLFAWVGFRTTFVDYERPVRVAGITKFNGWKLWNLAIEGLTSFSTEPLRIWSYIGAMSSLVSFIYAFVLILRTLIYGVDVPGYASLMVAIIFIGGLNLIGIGVIGEYIGRTYSESKRRPLYIIRKVHKMQINLH